MEYVESEPHYRFQLPSLKNAPVVRIFIIACIAVFVAQIGLRIGFGSDVAAKYGALNSGQVGEGQVWRLLSYAFLHDLLNPFHIILNLMVLYFFGPRVEEHLGSRRALLLVTASILLPALLSMAIYGPGTSILGASGVAYSLLAAYILLWPKAQMIFILFMLPCWIVGCFLLFYELYGIFLGFLGEGTGRAHYVHLAGAAIGVAFIYAIPALDRYRHRLELKTLESNVKRADEILRKISEEGIESLTSSERRFLDRYSKNFKR